MVSILKFLSLPFSLLVALSNAATFTIHNNCSYTVWAAALPGGGRQLNNGQVWTLNVAAGTKGGRIWPRTYCSFNGTGQGWCQTGDCNGQLACQGYGSPPYTLAEYSLNQYQNLDFFDISLLDGFNVPMEFCSNSAACSQGTQCNPDNNGYCPYEVLYPGGCYSACNVFNSNMYCCNTGACGPTKYSILFKEVCPNAISYPDDNQNDVFTCASGTNYRIVFCP